MFEKQNKKENLQLLKAMRIAYNQVKEIHNFRISVNIALPISSIIASISNKNKWSNLIIIISSIWIFGSYLLKKIEKNKTVKGAKIQEKFDVEIFNISWNSILVGEKIRPEEILNLAKKYKEDEKNLENWYIGLNSTNKLLNILIAQRTNLVWGFSLKKIYLYVIIIILSLSIILSFILGCLLKMTLKDFLIIIFIPSLSLITYMIETIDSLCIQRKKQLEAINFIEKKCESIKEKKEVGDISICRNIQDFIFLENRVNGTMIPNWLYKYRREEQESSMLEVNKKLTSGN